MTDIIPIDSTQLPASLAAAFSDEAAQELSGGISAGFPVMSFRGRVWRIKAKGEEYVLKNQSGEPRASIEVVLLAASSHLSKIYYDKVYQEGDDAAPRCWSVDGVKPDMQVEDPISPACAACPNNVWGSKITPQGSKVKACSDNKRIVCVPAGDIQNEAMGGPMLLRIPGASLQNLLKYNGMLSTNRVPFFGVVTRLSFDLNASYPKLECTFLRVLNADEAQQVLALRAGEATQRILDTTFEPTLPPMDADEFAAPAAVPDPTPAPAPQAPPPAPPPAPPAEDSGGENEDADAVYDSAGVKFDPELHSSNNGVPTFKKDGTFRKKRGAAAPQQGQEQVQMEPDETPAPAGNGQGDPVSTAMDSLLGDVLQGFGDS